jgi:hypothetical protein
MIMSDEFTSMYIEDQKIDENFQSKIYTEDDQIITKNANETSKEKNLKFPDRESNVMNNYDSIFEREEFELRSLDNFLLHYSISNVNVTSDMNADLIRYMNESINKRTKEDQLNSNKKTEVDDTNSNDVV